MHIKHYPVRETKCHIILERSTMLLMGKVTSFRLGHFQQLCQSLPEGISIYYQRVYESIDQYVSILSIFINVYQYLPRFTNIYESYIMSCCQPCWQGHLISPHGQNMVNIWKIIEDDRKNSPTLELFTTSIQLVLYNNIQQSFLIVMTKIMK